MRQDVGVVAAGFLQGIGQDGQPVEGPLAPCPSVVITSDCFSRASKTSSRYNSAALWPPRRTQASICPLNGSSSSPAYALSGATGPAEESLAV